MKIAATLGIEKIRTSLMWQPDWKIEERLQPDWKIEESLLRASLSANCYEHWEVRAATNMLYALGDSLLGNERKTCVKTALNRISEVGGLVSNNKIVSNN